MTSHKPLVVVIAGPNGAGKSTSAPLLLRDALEVEEFVNADSIANGLSAFHPERVAISSGRLMLRRIKHLANSRRSFAFETTLASKSFAPWLSRLRDSGYHVHLAFLALREQELAIARVAARVALGGHSVPKDVIRRRFVAGLRNFFELYKPIATTWELLDNMDSQVGPQLVASGQESRPATIVDQPTWSYLREAANS